MTNSSKVLSYLTLLYFIFYCTLVRKYSTWITWLSNQKYVLSFMKYWIEVARVIGFSFWKQHSISFFCMHFLWRKKFLLQKGVMHILLQQFAKLKTIASYIVYCIETNICCKITVCPWVFLLIKKVHVRGWGTFYKVRNELTSFMKEQYYSNFSCMFLNPNNFFQFEFYLF